jgi:hypothetical protein
MTSNKILKRLIPMVLVGAVMLVFAMPMTASARDWDHHDNGRHDGWVQGYRDDFHHYGWVDHDRGYFSPAPRAYYPNNYSGYAPAYGTGYAGLCGNLTRLQNVYRQDRATGHPAAANDVVRQMQGAEARCGGVSSVYPYSGYIYGQNGSAFAPRLGNFLGLH